MSVILTIDPGTTQSAWLLYNTLTHLPIQFDITENQELLSHLRSGNLLGDIMIVEMMASQGMAVGQSTFETCCWIGRFIEAHKNTFVKMYRAQVKMTLCGSMRAKDGNIRQAILDIYGGKEKAIGKKANMGPLYGVSNHVWSALALAVTYEKLEK